MSLRPTWMDVASTMRELTDRQLVTEVEHLIDGRTHPVDIAARLGATLSGVENRLSKIGRDDLAEKFTTARAAERAAGETA